MLLSQRLGCHDNGHEFCFEHFELSRRLGVFHGFFTVVLVTFFDGDQVQGHFAQLFTAAIQIDEGHPRRQRRPLRQAQKNRNSVGTHFFQLYNDVENNVDVGTEIQYQGIPFRGLINSVLDSFQIIHLFYVMKRRFSLGKQINQNVMRIVDDAKLFDDVLLPSRQSLLIQYITPVARIQDGMSQVRVIGTAFYCILNNFQAQASFSMGQFH